jgi:hypothetical protein
MKLSSEKAFLGCVALTLLFSGADQANAESFTWTYTSSNNVVEAAGTLDTVPYVADEQLAVGGSIISGVGAGLSLLPFGPTPGEPAPYVFIVDNVIYNPSPDLPGQNVDYYGLIFGSVSRGEVNIWGNNPRGPYLPSAGPGHDTLFLWTSANGYSPTFTSGTFSLTPSGPGPSTSVPEPSSFALAAFGGIGLVISAFRRRRMSLSLIAHF